MQNTLYKFGYTVGGWKLNIDGVEYSYEMINSEIEVPAQDVVSGIYVFTPMWIEEEYTVWLFLQNASIIDVGWTKISNNLYESTYTIESRPIVFPNVEMSGNVHFFGWRVTNVYASNTLWRMGDKCVAGPLSSGYFGNVRFSADYGEFGFVSATINKVYGDENFFNPLLNSSSYDPTYRSSDERIATVDALTGEVSIKGVGTVMIYATIEQENGSIENGFTVIISKATLTLSTSDVTITYGDSIPKWEFVVEGFVYGESLESLGVEMHIAIMSDEQIIVPDENTNVGIYSVYPNVELENYNIIPLRGILCINPRDIVDATVTGLEDFYEYTGSIIEPNCTVIVNGKTLVKDVDYVTIFQNEINVGVATITFVGINNYTGSKQYNFQIVQRSGSLTLSSNKVFIQYGNAEYVTMEYEWDGDIEIENSEPTKLRATLNPAKDTITLFCLYYTGKATITIRLIGGTNFTQPSAVTCEVTFQKREVTFTSGSKIQVENGSTIRDSNVILTEGSMASFDGITDEYSNVNVTGSQREVGTSYNTFTIGSITRNGENYFDYYNITYNYGTLTVLQKDTTFYIDEISGSVQYGDTTSFNVIYTGNGTLNVYCSNENVAEVFFDGSTVTIRVIGFSYAEVYITVEAVPFNSSQNSEEMVYTLHILQREIQVTSESIFVTYDGNPHTCYEAKITSGSLANFNGIEDVIAYNFTGVQTSIGISENTFTAVITRNGVNVSNYYKIKYVYGTLEVYEYVANIKLNEKFATITYGEYTTFTYTYDGDGIISVRSSNPNVIEVIGGENIVRVTAIGYVVGSVEVIVSATKGTGSRQPDDAIFIVILEK